MEPTIGVDNLDERDMVVLRSVLKLRGERWKWVDSLAAADVWLVDVTRGMRQTPSESLLIAQVIRLVDENSPPQSGGEGGLLVKPIKAARLMRLLDIALSGHKSKVAAPVAEQAAASTGRTPEAVKTSSAAQMEEVPAAKHPWRGKKLRFLRSPNLARYPVTAEMLGVLQRMTTTQISYDSLEKALPLDIKLIDEILGDASRESYLIDESGNLVPPLPKPAKKGFRLFS